LTKASLYVYSGPVAVLTCRRFHHTPNGQTNRHNRQTDTKDMSVVSACPLDGVWVLRSNL